MFVYSTILMLCATKVIQWFKARHPFFLIETLLGTFFFEINQRSRKLNRVGIN
jgi:hypothetical protein